jgi:release factor glutamine methyltransferase
MVKKRSEGTPVAYLVGYKEFYSLTFRVSPAVLIPRSETEHVVVEAIDWLKQLRKTQPNAPAAKVIDVCTGSGCIAVAIAKHAPDVIVKAVDISPEALEIAKLNVEQLGVADRVQLVQSDLLDGLSDLQEVDLIVSNPPYITESEYAALAKSVREYEPKIALVAGADGLDVINRLLTQSHAKLRVGGSLIFEISPMLADKVRELVERDAGWKLEKIVKDLAGHSRVVVARKVA